MPVRYKGSGAGGSGGSGAPTVILLDDIGHKDSQAWTFGLGDTAGLKDDATALGATQFDNIGFKDDVLVANALPNIGDNLGMKDSTVLTATVGPLLASKDSWCDVIAGCVSDVNRNATDLSMDGVVATRKDPIFGWDLSALPAGATVTAATVRVNMKTAPASAATFQPNTISAANETWTEAAVKCSTIPAVVAAASAAVPAFTTSGVDIAFALNAAGLAAIAAQIGVGSFSLRLVAATTLLACVLESKDEGTNNANGPRLSFTFAISR